MATFEIEVKEEVTRKKQVDIDLPAYFVMGTLTPSQAKDSEGYFDPIVRVKAVGVKSEIIQSSYPDCIPSFMSSFYSLDKVLTKGMQVDKSEWDFAVSLVKKRMEG